MVYIILYTSIVCLAPGVKLYPFMTSVQTMVDSKNILRSSFLEMLEIVPQNGKIAVITNHQKRSDRPLWIHHRVRDRSNERDREVFDEKVYFMLVRLCMMIISKLKSVEVVPKAALCEQWRYPHLYHFIFYSVRCVMAHVQPLSTCIHVHSYSSSDLHSNGSSSRRRLT